MDRGLYNESNYEGIVRAAGRMRRLPLKPMQKLELLVR